MAIVSLLAGYETIERLISGNTMDRISQHCFALAKHLYDSLKNLKYSNGRAVVHFYHDNDFTSRAVQGAIVNFNVLHEDGSFVGFVEVWFLRISLENLCKSIVVAYFPGVSDKIFVKA